MQELNKFNMIFKKKNRLCSEFHSVFLNSLQFQKSEFTRFLHKNFKL